MVSHFGLPLLSAHLTLMSPCFSLEEFFRTTLQVQLQRKGQEQKTQPLELSVTKTCKCMAKRRRATRKATRKGRRRRRRRTLY